eukprot:2852643-Rhodomonas_salina.1
MDRQTDRQTWAGGQTDRQVDRQADTAGSHTHSLSQTQHLTLTLFVCFPAQVDGAVAAAAGSGASLHHAAAPSLEALQAPPRVRRRDRCRHHQARRAGVCARAWG